MTLTQANGEAVSGTAPDETRKRKRRRFGTGRVFQPKGTQVWYLAYYRNGKKIVETSRDPNVGRTGYVKAEAESLLRQRLTGVERGDIAAPMLKQVTYGRLRNWLLDYYREQKLKSLAESNGEDTILGLPKLDVFFEYDRKDPNSGWPLAQITSAAADKFRKQRLAEPEFEAKREAGQAYAGHAVINNSLRLLRRMLNLFQEKHPGYTPPRIGFLPEPPARKGFVNREQFQALVTNLPDHLRPLVTYLYWTGGRLGETRQITWNQVDLAAAVVRLEGEQTKNSEPRTIPLSDEVLQALKSVETRTGLVFDTTNLEKEWQKACAAAGLGTLTKVEGKKRLRYEGLIIHDLRRSGVRNLVRAGVPERVAMKISGHKTRSVFERYNIVDEDDVRDAMRRLEHKVNGHSLAAPAPAAALPPAKD